MGGIEELLFDRGQCVNSINFDGDRVLLHTAADGGNRLWPGSREEHGLTRWRGKTGHLIDGLAKAHVQHPVSFVQHQGLQRVERDRPLLQVIEQTTRRGNDDMRRMLQGITLGAERLAATKG